MKRILLVLLLLAVPTLRAAGPMDPIAERYVRLALALGEHDPDFVDAYYGPAEWREQAKKEKKSVEAIESEARALREQVHALKIKTHDRLIPMRRTYLDAQLGAIVTRAEILRGKKLPFDEEARQLYGIVPPHHDDAFFAETLASLEKELPGSGALADRIDSYRKRFDIPAGKLDAVIRRAMHECRARTLMHAKLPAEESFTVEYVKNQPWSGYNWYKGNYRSVIQINTDLPVSIARALDLACHEGYPGHHAFNMLLEKNLVRGRGWVEYSVYPLFSPQSLVAEGSGNYGLELAFPGAERVAFDRDVLFPLAGLPPAEAEKFHRVMALSGRLAYAPNEAARRYLDGSITREQAVQWLVHNGLYSEARAQHQVDFIERYRTYVINYNAGRDAVKAYIESRPREMWWAKFIDLISTPRLLQ